MESRNTLYAWRKPGEANWNFTFDQWEVHQQAEKNRDGIQFRIAGSFNQQEATEQYPEATKRYLESRW